MKPFQPRTDNTYALSQYNNTPNLSRYLVSYHSSVLIYCPTIVQVHEINDFFLPVCHVHDTYRLEVILERNLCVSFLECVIGSVIPCNLINPVGFVVVPKKMEGSNERLTV